jgi:hypothetical protein
MLRTLAVLLLAGCGRSGFYPDDPPQAFWQAGDCSRTCERMTEQLVRDFSLLPQSLHCWEPPFRDARSSQDCTCIFERTLGVTMHGDFLEPLQHPSCP